MLADFVVCAVFFVCMSHLYSLKATRIRLMRGFAKMEDGRAMVILFGSQTGSAEDAARRIGREAVRRHVRVRVLALDSYNRSNLVNEPLVIFVVATTGQGDPPDNMKQFWRFLWRKKLPLGCLEGLKFGILGFGDSSYQKFNFIAKKLRRRMQHLRGCEVIEAGFSDDQHDYGSEFVVSPWIKELMTKVLQLFPLSPELEIIPDNILLPSTYQATFTGNSVRAVGSGHVKADRLESAGTELKQDPFHAVVADNRRVTAEDHWQDVRLITLDITGSELKYYAGDICYVQPKNMADTVEEFIKLLGLNSSDVVILRHSDEKEEEEEEEEEVPMRLRGPLTIQYLVENYFDINSIPKMYFWELLMHFADNELEKSKLSEFCSAQGQEELFNYCNRPKRSVVEVLKDFPGATCHIQFNYLFDMIPPLRPRAFSIASSQLVAPNRLQLLVAVVKYRTNLAAPRRGVCSHYLAGLIPSSETPVHVPIWIKKGLFEFPSDRSAPVLMVGPGTGCAPFRAFIQEAVAEGRQGKRILYFGCRNQKKDFYFDCEWTDLQSKGLLQLSAAFSRDQNEKVYVQHLLSQQSTSVWRLIERERAYVFIAGNSKNMPDAIRLQFKRIVIQESGMTDEEAENYLCKLDSAKRYQMETWS